MWEMRSSEIGMDAFSFCVYHYRYY
jgi:hypothetical protein